MFETFWRRVGARLIDGLILSPLSILSAVLFSRGISYGAFVCLNLATFIIGASYFVLLTGRNGQTVGKMATGVQVTKLDGTPIGYTEAFGRYLVAGFAGICITAVMLVTYSDENVISLITLKNTSTWTSCLNLVWLAAQGFTVANNDRRRAIHDYLAETQVVIKQHYAAASPEEIMILAASARK